MLAIVLFISLAIYQLYSKKVVTLDERLTEISGFEIDKSGHFWGINDGDNTAELHLIQPDGMIKRSIAISNAKNHDWEDMTQDDFGHFFIGDFGNNDNLRKWLTIYKIENPIDIKSDNTKAEIIKFMNPYQTSFPPKPSEMSFDLEAFVHYKNKLYLFSKNRKEPFDGSTDVYRIGDYAANHKAEYISQFNTCTHSEKLCWITSAAMSPDRTKLVLLDSERLWLFENWQGDDFFSGDIFKIDLGIVTQKEAVSFFDDNTLYVMDEEFLGIGRNAYAIKLDEVDKERVTKAEKKTNNSVSSTVETVYQATSSAVNDFSTYISE